MNATSMWAAVGPAPDTEAALLFGFSAYALFFLWRKASAKWANWFPALTFVTKGFLYFGAAVVVYLFLQALGSDLFSRKNGFAAIMGAAALPLIVQIRNKLFKNKEKIRRGAKVASVMEVNALTAIALPRTEFKNHLNLSGLKLPRGVEPYHLFVVGSTGSGKSVAITQLLDQIEERGDIALVVDSGGEFSSRYFRPGRDHIINPFDARCAPWSPTAELEGPWDAEALAKSMVPDGTGESKEWNSYAQTFVTAVLRRLHETQQLSILSLLYYVQSAPIPVLEPFLEGTSASAQFASEKTFGSIRTIATNYLATYSYLRDNASPFSIAKFIRADAPGFLFFTYRDDQLDSLRNMISCALDIASRTILALPANKDRRIWLIIDEFASIGKVQSIEAVATKARKMGGCLLIGLQSVSQLKDRYGDNTAQTILGCLSSWLILRCSDADTSEYISKYIGDSEISRMTDGSSSADSGASQSKTQQIQTQRAIMPVELQRLANLQGFFKLAGDYPICEIKLSFPDNRPKISENYADRDFAKNPMLTPTLLAMQAAGYLPSANGQTKAEPVPDAEVEIVRLDAIDLAHADVTSDRQEQAPRFRPLAGNNTTQSRHMPEYITSAHSPEQAWAGTPKVDPRMKLRGGRLSEAKASLQFPNQGLEGLAQTVEGGK